MLKTLGLVFCFLGMAPCFANTDSDQFSRLVLNSQYFEAKTKTDLFLKSNSQNPLPYLWRAIYAEWMQTTYNQGRFLEAQIIVDLSKAKDLAEKILQTQPHNIEAKVQLGQALLYLSRKQIDAGQKVKAGQTMKQAKNVMEAVKKADPQNPNTAFAIGLFDYFADNVPSGLKFFASILGIKGNKKNGLALLKQAELVPHLTRHDAVYMLFYIYMRKERDYKMALIYAQKLVHQYPKNLLFKSYYGEALVMNQHENQAKQVFEALIPACDKAKLACPDRVRYVSRFYLAQISTDSLARSYASEARSYAQKIHKHDTFTAFDTMLKKLGLPAREK